LSGTVSRAALLAAVLALALAWFGALGHRKLIKPDEGRYGEIPREMVASGDWLTPRLNDLKYFEKPPLQYWATAVAYSLFGVSEWATRLWSALCGFAGVLLAFFVGRRLYGETAGLAAAAALAGAALYTAMSQLATLDMGTALFLSLAIFATLLAQLDGTAPRARLGWMLAGWAAMALAMLSKGLIGIVLPMGAVALYVLWNRDFGLLRRLHILPGAALFLAIAAPWFIAVSAANPEFARFFFVHEHFERFLTTQHERKGPLWYFVPVLLAGFLPWLLSLVGGLWTAARRDEAGAFRPTRFLLAWCAVVFAFFSLSGSKLPPYILPIFPALALLAGAQLAGASRRMLAAQAALAAFLGLALLALLGLADAAPAWLRSGERLAAYRPWLVAAAALLALPALLAAWLAWRGQRLASVFALAAGGLACTQLTLLGHGTFAPIYSAYDVVARARPALPPRARFYAVNQYDHTLPFYLGRTVTIVAQPEELGVPVTWEPEKYIPDLGAFAAAWGAEGTACGAFAPAEFEAIRAAYGLAARVVATGPRYLIACKP
jgi:4-amino-4-deoxy-L-arabinose transferase-like glycosyltransferase